MCQSHCLTSVVTLFSKDGEGNPLLLMHRKTKDPANSGGTIVLNNL